MIQVKSKHINGAKYEVTQMTARTALKMQARLIKFLGPCLSEFFVAKTGNDAMCKAMKALALSMDENIFDSLVLDLMQYVRKDGIELKSGTIDLEFGGQLNTLFEVVSFVLEANYADFFAEGGIIKVLMDAAKETDKAAVPPLVQGSATN